MSLLILAKGFSLGLTMIVPIGSQNSMLLKQGIDRHYHIHTAILFIFYDLALIAFGVLSGSVLLTQSDMAMNLLTWGGIAFLSYYGAMLLQKVVKQKQQSAQLTKSTTSFKLLILTSLMVTFLNPHAYIDTVMVIGSVSGQYLGNAKYYFMIGTMLASIVWFLTLALGAAKLSPQLNKPKIRNTIDVLVALMMWAIAFSLYLSWLDN